MDLSTKQGRKQQGKRIQQAAESAGLSLEALARAVGCSRALIYQYVSGATLAQPDKMQRIASVTGVPLSRFYETSVEPDAEGKPQESAAAQGRQPSPGSGGEHEPAGREAPVSPAPMRVDEQRLRQSLASLQELARAYASGPDPAAQLSVSQRIIPLARELGDRGAEAESLLAIGNVQFQQGDLPAARQALEEALSLFSGLAAEERALACRQSLGAVLTAQGDLAGARRQFEAVAASAQVSQRWKGLLSLGALAEWQGDYHEAMNRLDETEAELERSGDPALLQAAAPYVGANRVNVFLGCGDYRHALDLATKTFADAESTGNPDQYVECQLNVGVCLTALGEYVQALDWLQRAAQVARLLNDEPRETTALSCLAETLTETGRFDEAKAPARQALAVALAGNTSRCQILAHRALGTVYLRTGLADEARYHLEQAAQRAASVNMVGSRLWCDLRLAEVQLVSQEWDEAERLATRVGEIAHESGSEHVEAEGRLIVAQSRLALGDVETAAAQAETAVKIAAARELPEVRLRALHALARCAQARGNEAAAEKQYQSALTLLRRLRRQFQQADQPDTLLEDDRRARLCTDYVHLLLKQQRTDEVQRVVDRCDWPPLEQLLPPTPSPGPDDS